MQQSGSTTLTLDKAAGTAHLQRKMLMFKLKPMQASLADVVNFEVDAGVDRASGIDRGTGEQGGGDEGELAGEHGRKTRGNRGSCFVDKRRTRP